MISLQDNLKIFISSTCHDLKDIRGGIKYFLEKEFNAKVFANEYSDFNVRYDLHSYEVCLTLLKTCDLVICLIDNRYGGAFQREEDEDISITRQEIRIAFENEIPVMTFVRNDILKEKDEFKKFIKTSNEDKNLLKMFDEFNFTRKSKAESPYIYNFIDEITYALRSPNHKSNWIIDFESLYDLQIAIERQIKNHLLNHSSNYYSHFPKIIMNLTDKVKGKLERSNRYNKANIFALELSANNHDMTRTQLKNFLRNNYNRVISKFAKEQIANIELSLQNNKSQLIVSDRSLELMNPFVWKSDLIHKKILDSTKNLARKYKFNYKKHIRITSLVNPERIIYDKTWRDAFCYYIEFHKKYRIGLGINMNVVDNTILGADFSNYYIIPDRLIAFFEITSGLAIEFEYKDDPELISQYSDYTYCLIDFCNNEDKAFWIKDLNADEAISKIISIIS